MSEPKPVWITNPTLPAALDEAGRSTMIVSKRLAAVITRLQQLANMATKCHVPAVARVDLRTWAVTLETGDTEQALALKE